MAAKIKDGLFIGDADSAGDAEFLDLNKIVNLGNLAAREVPNRFSAHGLVYLSLNWQDHNDFVLFDPSLSAVVDIVSFVDESLKHGQSVLLFSTRGVGRCGVAACVYLMYKYRWGFEKAYDYVVSKKPDIDINRGFVHQLFLLDKKLFQLRKGLPPGTASLAGHQLVSGVPAGPSALSRSPNTPLPLFSPISASADVEKARREDWEPFYLQQRGFLENQPARVQEEVGDELLLIYSYLNSKNTITAVPGPYPDALRQSKAFAIRFNPDLLLNHQYEEPGGRFVIATSLSSGKPHPPLPLSPRDSRHGSNHGPGHTSGILKGGKHYNVYRRKQNKTAGGFAGHDRNGSAAPGPVHEEPRGVGFESTRSIGFDSPPRGSAPLASGGWASPEQRLHDILDDLSNHNAEPAPAPLDNNRLSRPKGRSKGSHSRNKSGELTDTSDEDEGEGAPFVAAPSVGTVPQSKEFLAESKAAVPTAQRQRDSKAVRAESKVGAGPGAPMGFKEAPPGGANQAIYRPAGDAKAGASQSPSLYDLANMQVDPSFQHAARHEPAATDSSGRSLDHKAAMQFNARAGSKVPLPAEVAESKHGYVSHTEQAGRGNGSGGGTKSRDVDRHPGGGVRPYGERDHMFDDLASDVGQHSMLTGGGTIEIEAEDEDDIYMSTASNARVRHEERYKQADEVTQSLLRAKHLAEDAMGRASHSYQAQQERQSHTVQQQDRARQRQGENTAPRYGSQSRAEAWSSSGREPVYQTPSGSAEGRSRGDGRGASRESVAAAAVAAAEAMANYRNAPGPRQASSRGTNAMPRFDSGGRGNARGVNRTNSSDTRRPSVDKREEQAGSRKKPEWVGTSDSLDSTSSARTPKVYRHGSPAPRTANSSSSRLSQTDRGGSTASLRRDSLGRDSLGSTAGDSIGTQRSRESSSSSYRRPSPSPYEQRQSRVSQSSRPSSAGVPARSARGATPPRGERPDSSSGPSNSRSSTPTRKTGWRF